MSVVLVNDEDKWNEMYSRLSVAETISFDTETTCLDPLDHRFKVVGLAFAVDPSVGYYVPLNHLPPKQKLLFDPKTGEVPRPIIQLPEDWVIERVAPLLEERAIMGHGLKFDYQAMKVAYGVVLNHIIWDSMSASHLIDERGKHGLKYITEKYLGYKPLEFEEVVGKVESDKRKDLSYFDYVHPEDATPYAAPDAVNPIRLKGVFDPLINDNPKFVHLLYEVEVPNIPVIAKMELVGTNLDTQHLVQMHNDLKVRINKEKDSVQTIARNPRLNPGSDKQMVELIYGQMNMGRPSGRKNASSNKGLLDKKAVEKMVVKVRTDSKATYGKELARNKRWSKQEVLDLLKSHQALAKLDKLQGTYTTSLIDLISDDGRLHTLFNQHVARSGRLSSSQPNFQNLTRATDPKDPAYGYDVRKAFQADPGWVYVLADYSAMEMRICAAISGCPEMTAIITGQRKDSQGNPIDIHLWTAAEAFKFDYEEGARILADKKHPRYMEIKEYRQKAKPVNFGILYGMTEFGLAAELNDTVAAARGILAGYKRAYWGVAQWMEAVRLYLRAHLFTETVMGRRRRMSHGELFDRRAFETAYKACMNHTIQGTGADIVKASMIKVDNALIRMGARGSMAMQIHDEIIVHCPEREYERISRMMIQEMFYRVQFAPHLPAVDLPVEAEVKRTLSKFEEPIFKCS